MAKKKITKEEKAQKIELSKQYRKENTRKTKSFFDLYSFYFVNEEKNTLFYIRDKTKKVLYVKKKIPFYEHIILLVRDYCTQKNIDFKEYFTLLASASGCNYDDKQNYIIEQYLLLNNRIEMVENMKFKPIEEEIIIEDDLKYLNNYQPPKYLKKSFNNGCKDETKFPNIKELLFNLSGNDEKTYNYLLKVLSHSINKPEIKWHGYLMFQGDGASGKGTFFDLIMYPIFTDKYFYVGDEEDILRKNFNAHTAEKLWVFIEEKDKSQNKKNGSTASKIKMLTGNKKTNKESKGVDTVEIDDFKRYGFTSNEYNPGLDLKNDDRRCSVIGYSQTLGGSIEKAPIYRERFEKEIPKELDNFVSYLKNLEFEQSEIFTSLNNTAKQELINLDLTNAGRFIDWLKVDYQGLNIKDINEWIGQNTIDDNYFKLQTKEFDKILYIQTSFIYDLFKVYCKSNSMSITSVNNFFAEFYQITKITKNLMPGKQTGKDKDRKRYILYDEFKKYFGIDPEENKSEIETINILDDDEDLI